MKINRSVERCVSVGAPQPLPTTDFGRRHTKPPPYSKKSGNIEHSKIIKSLAFFRKQAIFVVSRWQTGTLSFPKQCGAWLDSPRSRIDALTAAGKELNPPADFLWTMITILSEIDPPDARSGNYAFRNIFYDWIQPASNLRVQASLLLLRELAAEPSGAGQCVSNLRR